MQNRHSMPQNFRKHQNSIPTRNVPEFYELKNAFYSTLSTLSNLLPQPTGFMLLVSLSTQAALNFIIFSFQNLTTFALAEPQRMTKVRL
jgi:hypothetical protein